MLKVKLTKRTVERQFYPELRTSKRCVLISDSVIFLWHYQEEKSSRPDLFNELENGPEGESNPWAENWSVLKILRGHLQVISQKEPIPNDTIIIKTYYETLLFIAF